MKILVTGGAGFIGSHVTRKLLDEGNEIVIIDDFNDYYDPAIKRGNISDFKCDVEIVEGDIRDAGAVERAFAGGIDAVIHLAARAGVRPSIADPDLYVSTNIQGTLNLLKAAQQTGIRNFVFASSSSVYGVNEKVPFAETDLIQSTISPYAMTKLAGEQMCSNFSHLYGMRAICLRLFTVYGPGQRPDLAIHKFTKRILNGEALEMYGDGSSERDYTYVDDIVQGITAALRYEGPSFDIFNLGESETTSLKSLIDQIAKATGKDAIINQLPDQAGDVPRTYADISKAKELLGYKPGVPISEGIPKFVEWFERHNSRTTAH